MEAVEALKARGLSEHEIEQEAEGGSDILDFLKAYDRKTKEKAKIKRVIDKTEDAIKQVRDDVYGKEGPFMDCKILLKQQAPVLDREVPSRSFS